MSPWECLVCHRQFTRAGSARIHAGHVHDLAPSEAAKKVRDVDAPRAPASSAKSAPPAEPASSPRAGEDEWEW